MARGTSNSSASKKKAWEFKGFINHEFSAEEIVEMLKWFEDRTVDIPEILANWCDAGWKTSQSYDATRNLYIFSATAKTTRTNLDGWVLQIRHTDLHRLLCSASYVLDVLIENDAIQPDTEEDDKYNW